MTSGQCEDKAAQRSKQHKLKAERSKLKAQSSKLKAESSRLKGERWGLGMRI